MFRTPNVVREMSDQGDVHIRVEVRIGEDFPDQTLELKLQKSTLGRISRVH